jgi:aspartyl-tRNA(Asn)/glutamyl-tRNA(Gln) amidotransferase subunit B
MITGTSLSPNLVPIRILDLVKEIKREIPELPDEKKRRFISQYSITTEHANSLTYDINIADFYEEVASKVDPRLSATWIADVLKGELNYRAISMREASKRVSVDNFDSILRYFKKGVITERGATEIIREMLDRGGKPDEIIKRKGLASIGSEEMEKAVLAVIKENEDAVEDYKTGKKEAFDFLVGQVMKNTKGRAEPTEVRKMLMGNIKDLLKPHPRHPE